jgi:hypothetical protein
VEKEMTMTTAPNPVAARRRIVLGPALVLVAVAAVSLIAWLQRDGQTTAPYTDPAATGTIGLCDRSGAQVTSGSTDSAPFIWRAVGTTAAPAAYAGPGSSATLYAFQPRAGVDPTGWSGQMLTAAGRYADPRYPTAAATGNDVSLADFIAGYPAIDHGFVQLRLYLTAPDQPPLTTSYDALDLKVSGSSWQVVGGTAADCSKANSVSFETEIGDASAGGR